MAESKVYPDAAAALKGLTFDGMTVMSGGFGLSGNPENLIAALKDDGVKNITVIAMYQDVAIQLTTSGLSRKGTAPMV